MFGGILKSLNIDSTDADWPQFTGGTSWSEYVEPVRKLLAGMPKPYRNRNDVPRSKRL